MRYFLSILAVTTFVSSSVATSQESRFTRHRLSGGVAIEVPSHWHIVSVETRKNLQALAQAIMEKSGVERAPSRKEVVLAINATPDPPGATVRVVISIPPDYSRDDIVNASPRELRELKSEMRAMFTTAERFGGPKLLEMLDPRIEKVAGLPSLVLPYRRAGLTGPSPWYVTQYKIPLRDRLIEVTVSYREADQFVWKPIIEQVRRSIQIAE